MAERDADLILPDPGRVPDFLKSFSVFPTNHAQLWELACDRLWDLKEDLEQGDDSMAAILRTGADRETSLRNYIAGWCRDRAAGAYSVPQEEELASGQRPDLRFHGTGFDTPVPIELKIADNRSGSDLFERLDNQLCGDYLRDPRSNRGIFLLVYKGDKSGWKNPAGYKTLSFQGLCTALKDHWDRVLRPKHPKIDTIAVIGIDLTLRARKSGQA